MRTLDSIAVAISLALVGACGTDHGDKGQQEGASNDNQNTNEGGGVVEACPIGEPTFVDVLAPSNPLQQMGLAIDANGDVFVSGSIDGPFRDAAFFSGVSELSPSGAVLASLSFGSLVAADANGNVFVAGAFTAPIDFGNGVVLSPMGNIDVFFAKIDAKGHVVLAK